MGISLCSVSRHNVKLDFVCSARYTTVVRAVEILRSREIKLLVIEESFSSPRCLVIKNVDLNLTV